MCLQKEGGKKKTHGRGGWLNGWLSEAPRARVAEQSPPRSHTNSVQSERQSDSVCETSGRGWEASFKARCSGEGGLFYRQLLFGTCLLFFLFFFFFLSRGNNFKKTKKRGGGREGGREWRRKKEKTTDTPDGEGKGKVGKVKGGEEGPAAGGSREHGAARRERSKRKES